MLKAGKYRVTEMVGYPRYMWVCSIRKMFFVSLTSWVSPFLYAGCVFVRGWWWRPWEREWKWGALPVISPLILSSKPILPCPACNTGTFLPCHLVRCEASSVEGAGGTLEEEGVLPDSRGLLSAGYAMQSSQQCLASLCGLNCNVSGICSLVKFLLWS